MEDLRDLTKLIKKINKEALHTIIDLKPILTSVRDREGEPYDFIRHSLIDKNPDIDEEHLNEVIENVLISLLQDSESIIREMPRFIIHLKEGKNIDDFEDTSGVFLKNVWLGDIFDCTGIDAFRRLYDDLNFNRKSCNKESIVLLSEEDI